METPQNPGEAGAEHPPERARKRRIGSIKEDSMYGIELRRRNRRIRMAIAGAALLVVLMLVVVAAVYPGTDGFRSRFDVMFAKATGAEITVENAKFSPFHAAADQIELRWPVGNALAELTAEDVSASVLPQRYFGSGFGGGEVRAASGVLLLRHPNDGEPAMVPGGRPGESGIAFERIGIPELDVYFGDPDLAASAIISDAEASFYPQQSGQSARALLYSGTLEIPFWPEIILERAILEFPAGAPQVSSLRLRDGVPDINSDIMPGVCDISGKLSEDPAAASMLDLTLESFQIQSILGAQAGGIFIGRVDTRSPGDNIVRISGEDGLQVRADIVASSESQITMTNFPFLKFLSNTLDDKWFLNPLFDEAPKMVLIRDGGDIRFEDINFTATNRMAIRGGFMIASDESITGEIEIGVASAIIEGATARRLSGVFSAERSGFRWVRLELGGYASMPTDNFNALFVEAPLPDDGRRPPPPPVTPTGPTPPIEDAPPVEDVLPPLLPELSDEE